MELLHRDDILRFFEEVNSRLKTMDKTGELYIIGGAAISLAFGGRNATEDIDAIYKPRSEIRRIIKEIADEHNLRNDWLNNDAEHFITENMTFTLLFDYSNLKIFHIDAECLLAMKLASARPDTSPDMDDCLLLMERLGIFEEKDLLRVVELYTDEDNRDPAYRFFITEAQRILRFELTA
ncbi:MAG: hypothetical protein LBD23_15155 [Oscillospiraceae bacterium]|jgi:predicted nucleotidyltransferase|nr:hypothetical protein [Oscillospiraceae bacterium]